MNTFEPFLSLSLDKTLCKWSSCWRFVKHWPRLLQQTICPQTASTHLSRCSFIHRLLPNGTSAIKLSPLQLKSTFPQISPDDHVTKLGARQKLWKCFWRLNANVRFQIELKHFALTIATKNVYNQKYFPSMPRIESCAAKPKIVPMVTIVKI